MFVLLFGLFSTNLNAQTTIEIGETYSFTQEPSSTIDYQINLSAPGQVTIHMNNWISTLNWGVDFDRMYIYNSDNTPVSRNIFSTEEDPFLFHMFQNEEGLVFNIGQAGTYIISVHSGEKWGWDGATIQSYEMLVEAVYCNDAYEPNETISTATPISIGSRIDAYEWRQVNTSEITGDEDCYSVTVNTPGILKIELVDWIGIYNWGIDFDRLYVYNEDGDTIGRTDGNDYYTWMMGGGTDEEPVVIEMNLTQAGTYYLKFHAGAGTSITPYHFSTSYTAVEDTFEPNNELSEAKFIPSGDWNQAYEWRTVDKTMNVAGDEDYYYFFAADAGTYILTLDGWEAIYNWGADYDRLFIYDAEGNSVGASPFDWMMGNSPIEFDVPAAGKYYLQLHCGNTYSSEGYKFKLTGSFEGVNDLNNNALHFRVFPNPANDFVSVSFNSDNNKELTLSIYNIHGELLRKEIIQQNKQSIDIRNISSGTYLLEAKSKDNTGKQILIIQR